MEEELEDKVIELDDVSRAFFEAIATRDVCVELPEEDLSEEEKQLDLVGHLQMSLYGTRDAAMNWQEEIAKLLVGDGFIRGIYNPCLYWHPKRKVKALVHGDDFVSSGARSAIGGFNKLLKGRFDIKTQVVGPDEKRGEVKEAKILNRVVRWTTEGFELEADQRHAELIVEQLRLSDAKGVVSPGEVEKPSDAEENDEELPKDEAGLFRSIAARANYLAQDRPDIMFAVKEICSKMATPTRGAWKALKRLGRYLVNKPRMVMNLSLIHI